MAPRERLRFVLDHDVDMAVCRVVRVAGHLCWRAPAGLTTDDDVSVYADDKRAIVITHDREFTYRRRRHTFGWHVRLRCEQPDAPAVMTEHVSEVVRVIEAAASGVVEVSRDGVVYRPPRWL